MDLCFVRFFGSSYHIIRLEWDTLSLYRLLIKRMANAENLDTLQYLLLIPGLISADNTSVLGYIPTTQKVLVEQLIEQMIGHYMGKSPKQGVSYQWMPNHLQDAKGALAPRSFLKCFSVAAEGMLAHPAEIDRLTEKRLILSSMIPNALVRVSEDRIDVSQWTSEQQKNCPVRMPGEILGFYRNLGLFLLLVMAASICPKSICMDSA